MPKLHRDTARALVEAGYMPAAQYIEMFEPQLGLPQVKSPGSAPRDDWNRVERMLISTTVDLK